MNPVPIPWILCGECVPPAIGCDFSGSTANALSFGIVFLSTSATPVMWPPVPTPVMR